MRMLGGLTLALPSGDVRGSDEALRPAPVLATPLPSLRLSETAWPHALGPAGETVRNAPSPPAG